jgi:hypothetical protein
MVAQYLDMSLKLQTDNSVVIELSNWDYAVLQFVNPSGTISITATNDSGAVQSVTDGNYELATNFQSVQATKLADGTAVTSVTAAGMYKVTVVGRYLKIGGASATASKLLIMLAKIS